MLTGSLFVSIKPNAEKLAKEKGFNPQFTYPVLAIDCVEDDYTRFLISNQNQEFHWFSMNDLLRSKKPEMPTSKTTWQKNHGRSAAV